MENNVNIELDSLREQMGILRNKLDKQEIINEQLMRKSMNQSMSWIQKYVIFEIILVPLLLIYLAIMHVSFGLSWWLYAFVAVMLIVSVSADYYINHLNGAELLQGDLVDTSRKLLRMKSLRAKAFIIGIVAVLVWVAWLMWELYNSYLAQADNHDFASGAALGGCVGAGIGCVIGLIVAFLIFRKMQRTNDDVLAQINEITASDAQQ
ncbi:MAG: hypothetical protein IKQ89_10520 [Muribaculaceae bacterium]|nr:hypothetical protein [Muribaculaceae bacterium]